MDFIEDVLHQLAEETKAQAEKLKDVEWELKDLGRKLAELSETIARQTKYLRRMQDEDYRRRLRPREGD